MLHHLGHLGHLHVYNNAMMQSPPAHSELAMSTLSVSCPSRSKTPWQPTVGVLSRRRRGDQTCNLLFLQLPTPARLLEGWPCPLVLCRGTNKERRLLFPVIRRLVFSLYLKNEGSVFRYCCLFCG